MHIKTNAARIAELQGRETRAVTGIRDLLRWFEIDDYTIVKLRPGADQLGLHDYHRATVDINGELFNITITNQQATLSGTRRKLFNPQIRTAAELQAYLA